MFEKKIKDLPEPEIQYSALNEIENKFVEF